MDDKNSFEYNLHSDLRDIRLEILNLKSSLNHLVEILRKSSGETVEILRKRSGEITGYWYYDEEGNLKCSNCNNEPIRKVVKGDSFNRTCVYNVEQAVKDHLPYCPMCGARMNKTQGV